MTTGDILREAERCNRPIGDLPRLLTNLRGAFERYPGPIHWRERLASSGRVGEDADRVFILEYIPLRDLARADAMRGAE